MTVLWMLVTWLFEASSAEENVSVRKLLMNGIPLYMDMAASRSCRSLMGHAGAFLMEAWVVILGSLLKCFAVEHPSIAVACRHQHCCCCCCCCYCCCCCC